MGPPIGGRLQSRECIFCSYDFLSNIFSSQADFIIRTQHVIRTIQKICVNRLLSMLPVKTSGRQSGIGYVWGESEVTHGFLTTQGGVSLIPAFQG